MKWVTDIFGEEWDEDANGAPESGVDEAFGRTRDEWRLLQIHDHVTHVEHRFHVKLKQSQSPHIIRCFHLFVSIQKLWNFFKIEISIIIKQLVLRNCQYKTFKNLKKGSNLSFYWFSPYLLWGSIQPSSVEHGFARRVFLNVLVDLFRQTHLQTGKF